MLAEVSQLLVVAQTEQRAYRQAMLDRHWMGVLMGIRLQIQLAESVCALLPANPAAQAQLQRWMDLEQQFLGGTHETTR